MSKFNINPTVELHPFRAAIGEDLFPKLCNDIKSFIGRLETENNGKNVVAKLSGVTVTAKCVIKSKEGYSLQMPLNNPMSILIRFGMELSRLDDSLGNRKIAQDGTVIGGLESELPSQCTDWISQQKTALKQTSAQPVAAGLGK
jgi:hypothetical protein